MQSKIELLIATSGAADCPILPENVARDFGLSSTQVPWAGLERLLNESQPDVLLIDAVREQDHNVLLSLLRRMHRNYPGLKCVLLADELSSDFPVLAFQAGIRGILRAAEASPQLLGKCVFSVHEGQVWISNEILGQVLDTFSNSVLPPQWEGRGALSPREQQVMDLVVQGLSNRAIAEALRVTESTVKKYVYEVFNKTGASSRVELVLRALQPRLAA
jgi:DNA-binding NarL/FixJ family response regulator